MNLILSEWAKIPFYISSNFAYIFSISNLRFIIDLRGSLISRFLYTKLTLSVDEFIKLLAFLSPKLYFENPFLFLLFPFWVLGILIFVREKKNNIFLTLLFFAFIDYLIGQKSIYFTFPIAIIYFYLAAVGIKSAIRR